MIDLHCHILPDLDDGAKDLEEALEMAKIAEMEGIEKIVATPHLFRGYITPKDLGIVEEKRIEFIQLLDENKINIEVFSGAEVHISHNLIDEIKKNRRYLVVNGGSYIFVEFPPEHVFSGVKNLFFELRSEGIIPIITHPERNSVFVSNPGLLYELVQMGAFSQANSGSFTGLYGKKAHEAVCRFLELGLIHFIASDCHNTRSLSPKLSEAVEKAAAIAGDKNAIAFVEDNPQSVLNDQELPYFRTPLNPKEDKKSLYIKTPSFFKR